MQLAQQLLSSEAVEMVESETEDEKKTMPAHSGNERVHVRRRKNEKNV